MSGQTSEEKTEQPTPKKRRDALEKGQVATSKEIVSAAVVAGVCIYLLFSAHKIIESIQEIMLLPAQFYGEKFGIALGHVGNAIWDKSLDILIPIVMVAAVVAILANYFQIGPVFSVEPIIPKPEKISPISGFKKIFSMKNFIEFLKSVIKVLVLGGVCVYVIFSNMNDLLYIPVCGKDCIPAVLGKLLFEMMAYVLVAFIVISFFDYFFQQHQHTKDLKMTKQEVKQEHKDIEGSPEVKRERKRVHKEITSGQGGGGVKKAVKNSQVVVTNPTHLAIALHYLREEEKLPLVTIKGEAFLAKEIKKVALEEGIPIMENVSLAHALYGDVEANHYIPRHLLQPVAEVLQWVNQIANEKKLSENN